MFASLIHANSDRSPFGDFWFTPIGGRSAAGVQVTPLSAMRVAAVYACVRELAQPMGALPLKFYKKQGRKRVETTDHPLYKLLAKRPNRWQNSLEWREMIDGHLSLRGNAYNYISANSRGVIKELIPLHPDRMTPNIDPNTGDFNWRYTAPNGSIETYDRDEIWHIKGLAPDIYRGYNPIELARDSIGGALASQEYAARFFANDATPTSGWVEHPGTFKDKEARSRFRERLQEEQTAKNRGKMLLMEGGMKYHQVGVNNTDAQFLENRKFSVEDIARLFGVPPHRIGHLDRSTNNNIEHQGLEFVTYTMMPRAERFELSIESELLFEDDDTEIELDFSRLLRGDSKSRAAYYHNGILDGWLVRNEARKMEGLDPLDGLDEPLRPLNMVPESEADEEEEEMEGEDKPEPSTEKETDE